MSNFHEAFDKFMASPDLEKAILSSTKASWGGSGYTLELFQDGTYRVLWDNSIGNLYRSPGILIAIPPLTDDEYGQEDEDGNHDASAIIDPFFGNVVARLEEIGEEIEEELSCEE